MFFYTLCLLKAFYCLPTGNIWAGRPKQTESGIWSRSVLFATNLAVFKYINSKLDLFKFKISMVRNSGVPLFRVNTLQVFGGWVCDKRHFLMFWLILTLKAPSRFAADDTLNFSEKVRLDITCESSAGQMIHMKFHVLFTLNKKCLLQLWLVEPESTIQNVIAGDIVNIFFIFIFWLR